MASNVMRIFSILGIIFSASGVSAEETCSTDDAQCAETQSNSLLQSRTEREHVKSEESIPCDKPARPEKPPRPERPESGKSTSTSTSEETHCGSRTRVRTRTRIRTRKRHQAVKECDETNIGDGAGYRGCQTETISFKTCQRWDSQSPHGHSRTVEDYGDSDLRDNYCRNPDGEAQIWCYTTDPDDRWDFCEALPVLPCDETNTGNGIGYRGCQRETVSGYTCQRWDSQSPHGHSRTAENYGDSDLRENYCRNPDGEDQNWCYTTNPDVLWDFGEVAR